jgi:hypothetical protein
MFLCGLLESFSFFLPDLCQLSDAFELGFLSQELLVFQLLLVSERGCIVVFHLTSTSPRRTCDRKPSTVAVS